MPKKPRVRTLMVSQHVKGFKGSESLLKGARHFFLSYFLISLKGNQLEQLWVSSI